MGEPIGKSLILTFDEVRILLYSQGYMTCEGIYMPQKEYDPQDILQVVHAMEKRGLLILEEELEAREKPGEIGGSSLSPGRGTLSPIFETKGQQIEKKDGSMPFSRFVVRQDLQRMLQAMGDPAGSFIYRPGEDLSRLSGEWYSGPEYYCYILPDYCLVAERDWTRIESLRFRAMDPETFEEWRQEREEEAKERNLSGNTENASNNFLSTHDIFFQEKTGMKSPDPSVFGQMGQKLDAIL